MTDAILSDNQLEYASTTRRHSRLGIAAFISALAATFLFSLDLIYSQSFVQAAYLVITPAMPLPAAEAAYEHYSFLKAFAVGAFLVVLGLVLLALVTGIWSFFQRNAYRWPAIAAMALLVPLILFIMSTL